MNGKSKLGKGTFGNVELRGTSAVKVLKIEEKCVHLSAWREIVVTAMLNHPNIIKIDKVHIGTDSIEIYMPLYECDLREWWHKYYTPDKLMVPMYRQIAMGLQYIHASGIIHADIKPDNILVRGKDVVICDFGIAVPGGNNQYLHRHVQTAEYRAPEVQTKKYSYPIDCWSLGIIIAEISFELDKPQEEDERLPFNSLGRICRGLLRADPAQRYSAAKTSSLLSTLCRRPAANYVPAPIIQRPLHDLPIMDGIDEDCDPDVMRFSNRLYEAAGCKKKLRRACFYLTSCVYNFGFDDVKIDAATAGQILPGLRFTRS